MNVFTISAMMVISFIVCAVTVASLNVVFWISLAVFAFSAYQAEKNYKKYMSELDEFYGRDHRMD